MESLAAVKLALAQMLVEGGRREQNLHRAQERIAAAAAAGADLVLLPETLNCGWTHPSARDTSDPIPHGPSFEALAHAASLHGIWVCAGLAECAAAGEAVFNTAVLVDRSGALVLHYRKIHELDIARDLYQTGAVVEVAATEFGTAGIHICADAFAEGQWISRELCRLGAEFILSPCAWAVDADDTAPYGDLWRGNYLPVIRDHQIWIAGCSNVGRITAGPWQGRCCIGNSIVFDRRGREVITGPRGVDADALLIIDIT